MVGDLIWSDGPSNFSKSGLDGTTFWKDKKTLETPDINGQPRPVLDQNSAKVGMQRVF